MRIILLVVLWSAAPLFALDWVAEPGARSAVVQPAPGGKAGFTLLPPSETGINFTNTLSDAHAAENQIRLNGSGVAAGDVDGDGWCDLYFCGLENGNRLYRNLGNWHFVDITEQAGVACAGQYSTGAVFADIDGDGDLDLLVTGIGVGTRCFLNDGKGHFTEAPNSGLFRRFAGTTMTLADIDGDGDLDLYVANYRTTTIRTTGFAVLNVGGKRMIRPEDRGHLEYMPDGRVLELGEPHILYRNDGKGHFAPVRWTDGTFLDEDGKPLKRAPLDWGLSAMFRDINGDGWPDLYVCNDFQSTDKIWINDGHGRFRALPQQSIRQSTTFSMSVDFADLERDGHDDLFVACMVSPEHRRRLMQIALIEPYPPTLGLPMDRLQVDRNTLNLNRGDGTYSEIGRYAGLNASDWTWSAVFLDVDLDGYEDLLCSTGHMFDTQDLDAEARIEAKGPWRPEKIPQKLLMFPKMQQAKTAFHNLGNLTFEPANHAWGFDQVGVGHGMALADLDNDGDLDVIVNNLNAPAGVYRNNSGAPRIGVRLKGHGANTRGIGAKIKVLGGPVPQSQEMICGGRYLSGDDNLRVFAAGNATNHLRIEVLWPNGQSSIVPRAAANRIYEIDQPAPDSSAPKSQTTVTNAIASKTLFEDRSPTLNHTHHEELFDDFLRQPLLPNRLSQLGPGVAWCDLDGDGWEDLVIGSGKGGQMAAFRNDHNGGFQRLDQPPFNQPITRDQTGMVTWVGTNGAPIVLAGSANYEDGLAAGSLVRQFDVQAKRVEDSMPGQISSTGPLALGDVDDNGQLALFVGGRVVPGRYPEAATSLLFRNTGQYWELDSEASRAFRELGLVSGAIWTDLDGDGHPELVLACEWGPLRIFTKKGGAFQDVTHEWGLDRMLGWWTSVAVGDFDGDGRLDLVAGNWGLNTDYRASAAEPRRLYYKDFDSNGTLDLVEAYFDEPMKKWVPSRDLRTMTAAMPFLQERFTTYEAYAQASVPELFADKFQGTRVLEANTLASMLFLNRGGHFEAVPLPREAQFSPAFGLAVADFDGDGKEDLFVSQNFFATQPQTTRNDAGRGLLLLGDGAGHFQPLSAAASGIDVSGEQRGAACADYDHDGRVDLVVTENAAPTRLFHNTQAKPGLRVKLNGPAGNPTGIGAVVRVQFGNRSGPAREIHAGSGYWSQDAAVPVLATPETPTGVIVRWPGGKVTTTPVATGAKEITVNFAQ